MMSSASTAGEIIVSACGRTHRGRVRKDNQDRLLVADLAGTALPDGNGAPTEGSSVGPVRFVLSGKGALLLVADGMGGRAGGSRASDLAVTTVRSAMADGSSAGEAPSAESFVLRLRGALEVANQEIHEASGRDERLRGMGTTATLAGILQGFVYLAQVGDSRAYLVRQRSLAQLTRDQSLVQDMIDSGVLSETDAERVSNNMILQALGPTPSVKPEMTYHRLRRGDVLLLCSDGLSRVVRDDEIVAAVAESADCLSTCDRLIGLANDRGGPDNVTVLVARVDGEGLGMAEPADVVGRQVYATPEV
jgi:PPM family protein phosphatase